MDERREQYNTFQGKVCKKNCVCMFYMPYFMFEYYDPFSHALEVVTEGVFLKK